MSVGLVAGLIVGSLLVGAIATSYAEYRFQYNLYDLLKDKLLALLGKKS